MCYIKGLDEYVSITYQNPLIISSIYFYFCALINFIEKNFMEGIGISIVGTTSILYHLSYCICPTVNCSCNGYSRLYSIKNVLRYIDMIPNMFFGTYFTWRAFELENYKRCMWSLISILGYGISQKVGRGNHWTHLILVHMPVIIGFLYTNNQRSIYPP